MKNSAAATQPATATISFWYVLPAGKPAGADFHLQIAYHGSVITDAGNGVYFVGDRGAWYAHIGGEHFTPYDLTFHWPKRLTLVATGVESEAREDGETKSGRWRSERPFPTAGFNLSQYQMASTSGQPKIQVYANKELEEAILARLQFTAPNAVPPPSMLDHYRDTDHFSGAADQPPAPSPTSALKQLGASVQDSIHFFENVNGAFPFDHLSVTQIPGSFGQGWPGLVYLSTLAFLPPETQERAGLNEWAQSEARDLMPFHEVAHQWWGNVTGAASYRDVWIEEAMANYLALWYADSKRPGQHRLTNWLEHYRAELTAKVPGTDRFHRRVGPLVLGPRLSSLKVPDAYSTLIYGKGTWVMHMLREMLRDARPTRKDPDARFRELLRVDAGRSPISPALHSRFPARRRAAHDSGDGPRRHASHGLVLRPVGARHGLAALHREIRSEAARERVRCHRQARASGNRRYIHAPRCRCMRCASAENRNAWAWWSPPARKRDFILNRAFARRAL